MKQPKFKFGDMVIHTINPGVKFEIATIEYSRWSNTYCCSEYSSDSVYYEDDLVLFKEPKPVKLYAFKIEGEVKFYESETLVLRTFGSKKPTVERVAEYDIDYGVSK